jgi:hypothetical protein
MVDHITVLYTVQESDHFNEIDMGWSGAHVRMRNAYKELHKRKPEIKRPLVTPMCTWKDDIKTRFEEIFWGISDWLCLAEDTEPRWAYVNTVVKL